MVIQETAESGASEIDMRLELGELVRPGGASTPESRPKATPIRVTEPERSPGVMMPWARPLWPQRNAVQSVTEQVYG